MKALPHSLLPIGTKLFWVKNILPKVFVAGSAQVDPTLLQADTKEKKTKDTVSMSKALILNMLPGMLGRYFWKGIQLHHPTPKPAGWNRDLQRAFEDVSGQNLGWFFQQWVDYHISPSDRSNHNEDLWCLSQRRRFRTTAIHASHYSEIGTKEGGHAY